MNDKTSTKLEDNLHDLNEKNWQSALDSLLDDIHAVDRTAVRIWFRLYPLDLARFINSAEEKEQALRGLAIQGCYSLEDRVDSSHRFLYGHRYWPIVKEEIVDEALGSDLIKNDVAETVRKVAENVARRLNVDNSVVLGITAVGLMTLTQVGLCNFKRSPSKIDAPEGLLSKPPDAVVAERAKDDSQGLFGFLKTVDKKFSIIYDESGSNGRFQIIEDEQIASASAKDRSQDWKDRDARCWEGPVPVECTSASCGTCWIGVIAGAEKLSEMSARERRAIKVFGYDDSTEARPIIRLACQAKANGNVTIVIPAWNGVFGKKVYASVEDAELEPATTAAKALRKAVSGMPPANGPEK